MKNKLCVTIVVLLALIGLGGEGYFLYRADIKHQREEAARLGNNLILQISIADASIRSGDTARFKAAQEKIQQQTVELKENRYFVSREQELMNEIETYAEKTKDDSISNLLEVNLAANALLSNIYDLNLSQLDYDEIEKFDQDVKEFSEALEKVENKRLRSEYLEALTALRRTINELAVCMDVCTENSYDEKQRNFETDLQRYGDQLNATNEEYVKYFGVSELVRELDSFVENS